MRKQILTDKETKTFLMETFGCTRQQVWRALNFERDSKDARSIRKLALERGGKLLGGSLKEWETSHDTAKNMMVQKYGSRVKLTADFSCGEVRVFVDGIEEGEPRKVSSIPEFVAIQRDVELIASAL